MTHKLQSLILVEFSEKMNNISQKDAENAVITLLKYINPDNLDDILKNTPGSVINAFQVLFSGYNSTLNVTDFVTFDNKNLGNTMVFLDNIAFHSTCEHHILPIRGVVNIAYIPGAKIIGIGEIGKVVNIFANRLQLQEKMGVQIAEFLDQITVSRGVALHIAAQHDCMNYLNPSSKTTVNTTYFTGEFAVNSDKKLEFINMLQNNKPGL